MKKILKILTLVMLILTILKIGDTYAKYFAEANTANLSQDIARWVIKINDLNIESENGETVEIPVTNFTNLTNPHTASNRLSPASEGYMDLLLDPSGTDVAVRYDIEMQFTEVSNLAISARVEMTSGETLVRTAKNTYSGVISLADVKAGKTANLRCFITWDNDEDNNIDDSELGSQLGIKLQLAAAVTVSQYLGDELVEYVEPTT